MSIKEIKRLLRVCVMAMGMMIGVAACSDSEFEIEGVVEGADDMPILVEKSDFHGQWHAIDSTRTSKGGKFAVKMDAPVAPDIYRLNLDGKYIYVPIDSIETVTVKTSLAGFGSDYELAGTDQAVSMAKFEKELSKATVLSPDSLAAFKRGVFEKYIRDGKGNILSYYVLTKTVNGRSLYNPLDDSDLKYFSAVATAYKTFRPNDPRTPLLEGIALKGMSKRHSEAGMVKVFEGEESKLLEVELPDVDGKLRKLSDVASKGKPTVLIFSVLTHSDSPELNRRLAQIYESYAGGIEFYQVSLDPDQYSWREAARNLPWVNVYDVKKDESEAAALYNVSALPTFFIINSKGELIDRAETIEEFRRKL